jgi:hypothetical protein
VEAKKGAAIGSETRTLIDRWFSGDPLDDLLVPLYLRHLAPDTMAAAVEFYATEPGASFARKTVALWDETLTEPTEEALPEAVEWARQLAEMRHLDHGTGDEDLALERLVRFRYPDLSEEERAEIMAEWRRQGLVEVESRWTAQFLTLEEMRAALAFFRSPPGSTFRQGQVKARGDLGYAVAFRVEGLILPGSLLSPLAGEQYWPQRGYDEVMSFFGRPSFIVPGDGKATLYYAVDDRRAEELQDSRAVTEPDAFAGFDPSAAEEWLALDAEFRERYPDLADIPPPGHIWLAIFNLDAANRVEGFKLVQQHEGVQRFLDVSRRMLDLYRRQLESQQQ